MVIDPRWEKFYWTGLHERAVQPVLTSCLRSGMTFWDVGAHAGFFTLLASRLVGRDGKVHAFEPMPDTRQRLLKGVELNRSRNITIHDCALSSTSGQTVIYPHTLTVKSSLIASDSRGPGIPIGLETLDHMLQRIDTPDVIKIDAEGLELDVIRGGMQLISTFHPTMIVEFTNEQMVEEAKCLASEYTFEHLTPRHWLMR